MKDIQTLLEEAVALVDAARGFIVLYPQDADQPMQIAAVHNFDPAFMAQPREKLSSDDQFIYDALPIMAQQNQPILTYNFDETYSPIPMFKSIVGRRIRSVLSVPLRNTAGLLWCDVPVNTRKGAYQPHDLEKLVALVEQSDLS